MLECGSHDRQVGCDFYEIPDHETCASGKGDGFRPAKISGVMPECFADELLTLIIFRPQRDGRESGVVWSAIAKQAVERLGTETERVLALAGDFTDEADSVLDSHGIKRIAISHFGWTDDRWLNRRS
jgi:hypothetical protein